MNHYEALCVLHPKTTEEKVKTLLDKFTAKIDGAKGQVDKIESWGKRRLPFILQSYKDIREGLYYLIRFSGPSKAPTELQTLLQLTEEIVRFVVVRSSPIQPPAETPASAEPAVKEAAPING